MDKDKKVYLDVVEKQLNVTQNPIVSKITKHSKPLRKIKFRGKRLIDGTWIYGGFLKTQKINKYQVGGTSRYNTIIPETLGQYVGLHDKHGREIYEGDVVKFIDYDSYDEGFENAGVVKHSGNMFYITNRFSVNMEDLVDDLECSMYCEVIGNVHDSPQLLKGEEV